MTVKVVVGVVGIAVVVLSSWGGTVGHNAFVTAEVQRKSQHKNHTIYQKLTSLAEITVISAETSSDERRNKIISSKPGTDADPPREISSVLANWVLTEFSSVVLKCSCKICKFTDRFTSAHWHCPFSSTRLPLHLLISKDFNLRMALNHFTWILIVVKCSLQEWTAYWSINNEFYKRCQWELNYILYWMR